MSKYLPELIIVEQKHYLSNKDRYIFFKPQGSLKKKPRKPTVRRPVGNHWKNIYLIINNNYQVAKS
jgi:hypothetical protein